MIDVGSSEPLELDAVPFDASELKRASSELDEPLELDELVVPVDEPESAW